ncbi:MAG: hypothetical protein ACOYKE_10400 [Ferruginibacter sp.]
MQNVYTMINLTKEMLSCGVFNHLPDDDIAYIRQLVMQLQSKVPPPIWHPLVDSWYKANFSFDDVSPKLMHQCNEYLMRMQMPLLEFSFAEAY